MIDWQGLLKFSLQHTDGTKKSDFKEMSEQNKQWLQEAMKHYCSSEIERMKTILQQLSKPEQQSTEQVRLSQLEELQDILESLGKGSTLYKMGGHIVLLRIIFYSKYESNKIIALRIFSSINQNDAYMQTESINSGALELIELIVKQQSIRLRQNIFSAISSILRGENLEAKRIFLRLQGFDLMRKLLTDENVNSKRLKQKIFTLMRDLLFYDDRLHFTYNDLSSFSNTSNVVLTEQNSKQQQNSLTYDKNKEVINNELQKNQKYKGSVQNWLNQEKSQPIRDQYNAWLKEQEEHESAM